MRGKVHLCCPQIVPHLKKPELKWTSKQTSMLSTGSQASSKSVTQKGSVVSVSSADAHKSKRSEDPKDQTRKSVSSADSQKPETSKKRKHIESEQWTKVSYQKGPNLKDTFPKKNTVGVSRAGKNQSTADKNRSRPTPGATATKRGRATCFMKGCKVTSTRIKKHVIGRHLPMEAYGRSGGLESETRMRMFEELLLKIADILKCQNLYQLLRKVQELGYYPSRDRYYEITEADNTVMDEFSMWLYGAHLPHTPTISPPNLVASLVQWRALAQLINCIGEENINIEKIQKSYCLKVTKDTEGGHKSSDSKESSAEASTESSTSSSSEDESSSQDESTVELPRAKDKSAVKKPTGITHGGEATKSKSTYRPVSEVLRNQGKSNESTIQKEKSSSNRSADSLDEDETQLLQVYSEGSNSSDVQTVKKSGQHLRTIQEEEEMEVDQPPTVELQKSLPSTSAGVKSTCTTSAIHSAVETSAGGDSVVESHKPTYAEKLQCSPAVRPKAVVSKPGNLGAPYTGEEKEARLMRLVKRSEKIPFVDTHFHLNRLQEASHIESVEEILVSGPIPNYGKLFWSSIAEICQIQLRLVITVWMQWRVYCPMRNEVHTEFFDTAIMEA